MIEAARLGVYVSAEGVDQTKRQMSGLGDTLSGVAGKAMAAGGVLSAAVTTPLLMMGNRAVDAASDVMESMNKVDVVFGGSAGVVKAFADTAASNLGITEGAALEAAGTFGNMFDAMGMAEGASAGMSTQVLQMAADLGSFNNIDPSIMLEKLRSGLVGEAEPLRQVGILLDAESVKLKAVEMGLATSTKEVDQAALVQARLALITEQSGNAMGDFARTADGNANATRIMQASMQDLAATIGMQLLPYKLQLVQAVQQVVTWFQNLNPSTQGMIVVFAGLAAVVGPLLLVLGTMATAIAAIGLPVLAVVAAVGLLGAAWATNFGGIRDVAMPIVEQIKAWFGEVIPAAIAKFREIWATLVAFFEPTVQRIRDAVGPMVESFSPLGEKIAALWAVAEPILSALAAIVGGVVVAAFNLLMEIVAAVMPSIGTIIGNAIDIATTVLETLSTVVTEVVATIKDLLEGDFSGAWEHVQNIFETLKEAVVTIFGKIAEVILTVIEDLITAFTNWYKNLEKNSEFVRNVLTPALRTLSDFLKNTLKGAVDIVTGVFNGLKGAIDSVGGAIDKVLGWLDNLKSKLGSLKLPAWLTPGSPTPFEYGLIGINQALQTTSMQGLPEFADAMTVLGDAVDGALGVFKGIGSMEAVEDLPGRMKLFKDQVVEIIRELASLAGQLADMPQGGNWASAKAGMEAAMTVLGPLLTSLNTITGLGDMKLLTDIPARVAFIKEAILALVKGVAEMANDPAMLGLEAATTTGTGLSAFGKAIEGVFGPLREAAKAWETIKGFDFANMDVEPVLRWLASFGAMAVNAVEWARSWGGTAGDGMGTFITGIGTAVKGLADVAKAWETIQNFKWSVLDADAVVNWLAAFGGLAVKAANWAAGWAQPGEGIDTFVTGVRSALGGLVEAARAWEVLQNFKWNAGLDMNKVTEWLAALGGLALTALQDVSKWEQFQTIDAKIKDVAAYMQSAFGALSAAVQFTNELDGWKDIPDLEGKFDRLRKAIEYIVPQFELTRIAVGALAYEEVGKFAKALTDIAGGIQGALGLMQTDMSDLKVPDASFWEPLNAWIKKTFESFSNWLAANPNLTTQSPMVTAFGQALGGLMGGLRSAVELAAMLPEDWKAPPDSVWVPFTEWVKKTFESFYDYVMTNTGLSTETDPVTGAVTSPGSFTGPGLDLVGKFGAALSGLMGGLKTALELAINLPANWTAPDTAMWDSFTGWVQKVFSSFLAWVQRTHTDGNGNAIPFDKVGLDLVTAFGSALGALMGGLSSSFAVFSGLVGFVAPSEAQFTAFKGAVTRVFSDFTEYAKGLQPLAVAATKAFGESMGALFSGLNTALTFTSAVYKESPKFFEFLASAAAGAGGDFQVKMGLIMYAITETMTRFKTNVIDKVKTDWLPSADALLKAVQSVFGVLNTALNIFRDLNTVGMPDSKTITSFIDSVLRLFTGFTTGLGLTPGEVDKAGSGVRTTLGAWEKVISQDAQNWYTIGYAFGGMLAAGWGMSMQAQAQAGSFMLNSTYIVTDAIKAAIKKAFGIASPSRVMMGYGDQMAQGLGIGLQQGLRALGLPGMDGQPLQMAYAGLPQQVVRVQVSGDIGIGGQRVSAAEADEIARALVRTMRLKA